MIENKTMHDSKIGSESEDLFSANDSDWSVAVIHCVDQHLGAYGWHNSFLGLGQLYLTFYGLSNIIDYAMARTPVTSFEFARAFGNGLAEFLARKKISQYKAAARLGIGRATLNTYCHDSPQGTRHKPDAEFLYKVCVQLGFEFEYNGFKITASTFDGSPVKQIESPAEQLLLDFQRQFDLTDHTGTVTVTVRRPAGRVEVSLSLSAAS